jgi:hypothetical protein
MAKKTDPETEARVVRAYCTGLSAPEVALRCGVFRLTVYNILKRHGVARRHATHSVTEDYFAAIDTEEKAYWLGFLAADGCIRSPQRKEGRANRSACSLRPAMPPTSKGSDRPSGSPALCPTGI